MDAVQKANAGHPGTAMALAPLAYLLYRGHAAAQPGQPRLAGRDRFVLSAGHACILQYAALHLSGYDLLARRPAAVPPVGLADAWASRARSSRRAWRRRPDRSVRASPTASVWRSPSGSSPSATTGRGHGIVDYRVYAICSDGDLMEGVSQEAASIAGHLGLGQASSTSTTTTTSRSTARPRISFDTEDKREAVRGVRLARVARRRRERPRRPSTPALEAARAETARPSFVVVRSHIAYPAPHARTRRRRTALRSVRRRCGDEGGARLGPGRRRSSCPTRCARTWRRAPSAGPLESRVAGSGSMRGAPRSAELRRATGTRTCAASRATAGREALPTFDGRTRQAGDPRGRAQA